MTNIYKNFNWKSASLFMLNASQPGASDSVAIFSALLNSVHVYNVSCLGLYCGDICPKSYA